MGYGWNLERRAYGVYYFRQTFNDGGRITAKRFSLKTKDPKLAKQMAIQIKAAMANFNHSGFEIKYDPNTNKVVEIKTDGEADSKAAAAFLAAERADSEAAKAAEHARQLELLKLNMAHNQIAQVQPAQNTGESLQTLKADYLAQLNIGQGALSKYRRNLDRLVDFAATREVTAIDLLSRKFVRSYLEQLRGEGKNDNTIQSIFNVCSTFFNHLVTIGEAVGANPFAGHRLEIEKSKREPFKSTELKQIFTCEAVLKDKKLFFICLLMLTTGARPNEICQLWHDDIVFEPDSQIYTLRITSDSARGQTIKTAASKRTIYLHPLLIQKGFLSYITEKEGLIFELTKPADKTYSTFISAKLTTILRNLGIPDKTMYCFRHSVANHLKQSLVPQQIREDLQGHEGTGTNEVVYSQQYLPAMLKEKTEEPLWWRHLGVF